MNEARLLDEFHHWTLRLQDPFDKCVCRTILHCARKLAATPSQETIEKFDHIRRYGNPDHQAMCAAVLKIAMFSKVPE